MAPSVKPASRRRSSACVGLGRAWPALRVAGRTRPPAGVQHRRVHAHRPPSQRRFAVRPKEPARASCAGPGRLLGWPSPSPPPSVARAAASSPGRPRCPRRGAARAAAPPAVGHRGRCARRVHGWRAGRGRWGRGRERGVFLVEASPRLVRGLTPQHRKPVAAASRRAAAPGHRTAPRPTPPRTTKGWSALSLAPLRRFRRAPRTFDAPARPLRKMGDTFPPQHVVVDVVGGFHDRGTYAAGVDNPPRVDYLRTPRRPSGLGSLHIPPRTILSTRFG